MRRAEPPDELLRDVDHFLFKLLENDGPVKAAEYRERIRRYLGLTPCSRCGGSGKVGQWQCSVCQSPFRDSPPGMTEAAYLALFRHSWHAKPTELGLKDVTPF